MGYERNSVARLASRLAERIDSGGNKKPATASADERQEEQQLQELIDKKKIAVAMCWNSALYLLQVAGGERNRFLEREHLSKDDDFRQYFFHGKGIEAHNVSDIPGDSVVLIYKRPYTGKQHITDRPFSLLSHVVVSIDNNGKCAGSNNGCIGGAPNFSIVNLGEKLNWRPPDQSPLYIAKEEAGNRDDKIKPYQERLILYQEINNIF